jgi:hypothetical protein
MYFHGFTKPMDFKPPNNNNNNNTFAHSQEREGVYSGALALVTITGLIAINSESNIEVSSVFFVFEYLMIGILFRKKNIREFEW